jgi:hypothetical protein
MRRRKFIAGLGSAAVWPLAVRAQSSVPIIGRINMGAAGNLCFSASSAICKSALETTTDILLSSTNVTPRNERWSRENQ